MLCKKIYVKSSAISLNRKGGEASLNFFMWKKYYFLAEPQGGLGRPKVLTFSNILFWRHPLHSYTYFFDFAHKALLFKLYFDTNLMKYIVSENYNLSSYWLFTWVKAVHFSITEVWISYWTVNINIKTGDNQFNCQLCGKTFSQNDT